MPVTASEDPAGATRLGLVGLGWGSRVAAAVRPLPRVRFAAGHARSADARGLFSREFGVPTHARYEDLLADATLAGVVLMTPNRTHRELAVAALRAGKHVLVTKPVASSLPDAAEMIRVARECGRILCVGHQSRRHPALRELRRMVAAGALGPIRAIEGNTSSPTGLQLGSAAWRADPGECPGGPLLQLGIHYIDNFQHLVGPVEEVLATFTKVGRGPMPVDSTATLLRFAGASGYLGSGYAAARTRWIRLTGEAAAAHFGDDGSLSLIPARGAPTTVKPAPPDPERILSHMLAEEVDDFARCIRGEAVPEVDGRTGLRNLAVVLAAVESARSGKPIAVDPFVREQLGSNPC